MEKTFPKYAKINVEIQPWRVKNQAPEPPSLILSRFSQMFGMFPVSPPRIPPAIYNAKNAKNAKKAKKANHLQGANAKSATTKVCFITMAWAKKGGRRWSPPGGYN